MTDVREDDSSMITAHPLRIDDVLAASSPRRSPPARGVITPQRFW
jgi:hypothetical protein